MDFPAETADLRPARDARPDEPADQVVAHDFGEHFIMGGHVRPRPDNAHVAQQDIEELRQFINAQLPQPDARRIDAGVIFGRLPGFVIVGRVQTGALAGRGVHAIEPVAPDASPC